MILTIKNNLSIKKLIKKQIGQTKSFYWKISNNQIRGWKPVTIIGGIPFKLNLNKKLKKQSIKIVYFINSDISNCYLNLMRDQINNFIKSKIFLNSNIKFFFIIICSDLERRKAILKLIDLKKIKYSIEYEIRFSKDNHKEFEGINFILLPKATGTERLASKFVFPEISSLNHL